MLGVRKNPLLSVWGLLRSTFIQQKTVMNMVAEVNLEKHLGDYVGLFFLLLTSLSYLLMMVVVKAAHNNPIVCPRFLQLNSRVFTDMLHNINRAPSFTFLLQVALSPIEQRKQ